MILSRNMLKRAGRADIPVGLQLLFGTSLLCCCNEDSASGLVIEVFDDLDKAGADVVLLYGCPQSCMQNTVEPSPAQLRLKQDGLYVGQVGSLEDFFV